MATPGNAGGGAAIAVGRGWSAQSEIPTSQPWSITAESATTPGDAALGVGDRRRANEFLMFGVDCCLLTGDAATIPPMLADGSRCSLRIVLNAPVGDAVLTGDAAVLTDDAAGEAGPAATARCSADGEAKVTLTGDLADATARGAAPSSTVLCSTVCPSGGRRGLATKRTGTGVVAAPSRNCTPLGVGCALKTETGICSAAARAGTGTLCWRKTSVTLPPCQATSALCCRLTPTSVWRVVL